MESRAPKPADRVRLAEGLIAELVGDREALLAVVRGLDEQALAWATRNPGWTVRNVVAHVLASDTDLILLLEAAVSPGATSIRGRGFEEHQREMASWGDATPRTLGQQLRERADRWRALLEGLPAAAFSMPARAWWVPDETSFGEILDDWRGHDRQHGEDVRLALSTSGLPQ